MRRTLSVVLGTMLAVGAIAVAAGASSDDGGGGTILGFHRMAPVTGPFVGSANPIRGINGGGLPWQIDKAVGKLKTDGHLRVTVRGLVFLEDDPVPQELQGTNPIPTFRAVVSCLTSVDGTVQTMNLATGPFPASTTGDATIDATVSLPSPCVAPIVFVGPSPTVWFAATGA